MTDSTPTLFFERLSRDQELARTYQTAVAGAVRSAVWPVIVEMAAREGMAFSVDELGAWLAERQEELSEEALQGVTGGAWKPPRPISTAGLIAAGVLGAVVIVGASVDSGDDHNSVGTPHPISP